LRDGDGEPDDAFGFRVFHEWDVSKGTRVGKPKLPGPSLWFGLE
jgi:hypothetical protein